MSEKLIANTEINSYRLNFNLFTEALRFLKFRNKRKLLSLPLMFI
jgi:hypothetical protein